MSKSLNNITTDHNDHNVEINTNYRRRELNVTMLFNILELIC